MNAPAHFFEFSPEQQVIRLTESNRQLREENKELQATIAARESLIADTMREKVSLETDSEKINECLKLALGDEWNRENPIIVPYLIKRERDQLREELERKQIAYKQVNELLHACNSGSHIQLSERLVIACNKVRTLTTALTAAKEALQRIATQYPIDDAWGVKSLARHKCEQARDALRVINSLDDKSCKQDRITELEHIEIANLEQITTLTTALTAAKGALQTCRCLEPEQREAVADALARIAECEKG